MLPSDTNRSSTVAMLIAQIDALISAQVNAIMHHAKFRKLESAWRGLHYMVMSAHRFAAKEGTLKIFMLHATWQDLSNDVQSAIEFDQSELFRKVYSFTFDLGGGEPFGLLVGDYEIGKSNDDLLTLRGVSQVAAAAFAPFVAGAHPSLFGLSSFTQMDRGLNLSAIFEQPEYSRWRDFRSEEDARFIGLALPHMLLRKPYRKETLVDQGFLFDEDQGGPDGRNLLWGPAAWAFGVAVIRCFVSSGWLTDIRGLRRGEEGAGRMSPAVADHFTTDAAGIATKFWTDIVITDEAEREMSEMGFIPLCHCQDTEHAAFYGNRSVQKPAKLDSALATANAKVSSMLQYVLCASRFAHYLKVIARNKMGSIVDARGLEKELTDWVRKYVVADEAALPDMKAEYPLRGAEVEVRPGALPGSYACFMQLWPHSQMDELVGSLRLMTDITASTVVR